MLYDTVSSQDANESKHILEETGCSRHADIASNHQCSVDVSINNLRTMMCILFIMNVGTIFNADFGLFYNVPMQNGALFDVTQVIDTYVYRALMVTGDISMSAAAGLLQNVLGFICILTANGIVKHIDPDSSMF